MIGDSELIIIAIVALLLFGPDKLPELAKRIGEASGEFKKAYKEAKERWVKPVESLRKKLMN